jgi:hypothetical protein
MELPTFHIGVASRTTKRIKKSKKVNKKVKNISILPVYIFNNRKQYYLFDIKTHYWRIPPGIKVSKSVELKFNMLSTCSVSNFTNSLREKLSLCNTNVFANIDSWKPPQEIKSYLRSVKDKEKNEWIKVRFIYHKIFNLISKLNSLFRIRRINMTFKNILNTEDPVTLEKPVKPIYILNIDKKCTHVYEADTLRKAFHRRLLTSDYMFPDPQPPINLLTNQPFTMSQYISISMQFKAYGIFLWTFDRLKACEFNLKKFNMHFRQQLKLSAIDTFFSIDNDLWRETVFDYFNITADESELPDMYITKFRNALYSNSHSPYIKRWISLTKRFYIAKELLDINEIKLVENICDHLISELQVEHYLL